MTRSILLLVVLSLCMLSFQEQVKIPAGRCDVSHFTDITELHFNIIAIDDSLFTAVLLPGDQDTCPITIYNIVMGNMINDCDTVLNCKGDLYNLNGDYSFFIINDNILEEGYFDALISAGKISIIYLAIILGISFSFVACCFCMCIYVYKSYGRSAANIEFL